jgi:hypothetical protein
MIRTTSKARILHRSRFSRKGTVSRAAIRPRVAVVCGAASLLCAIAATATTALAEPVSIDCNSIKATTVPVQLRYKFGQNDNTFQIYRGTGGSDVVWSRLISPYHTTIIKAITINGFATETSLTSLNDKVMKDAETKLRYVGIQIENDDRHHSETYKLYGTMTYRDGSRQELEQDVSYTFQSKGEMQVGPCVLIVYRGEGSSTQGGQTIRMFHTYFPELRVGISAVGRDILIEGISTSFDLINPLH